jgi:hypothetical protein
MMLTLRRLPRAAVTTTTTTAATRRCLSQFYTPTTTESRSTEAGRGGRMSEAGIKVAVFGGNGFLGRQLAAHLGTLLLVLAL